jgi:hypothetical protein
MPLAAVRRGNDGMRFFNLRRGPPMRAPTAAAGVPVRDVGRELPRLLQAALGTPDFSARSVAAALGRRGEARVLRFSLRGEERQVGGYSIVVAP